MTFRSSEVGRTRDAGWQIGVSKTVNHPVEAVWDLITSPAGLAIWLGEDVTLHPEPGTGYRTRAGVEGEIRSVRDHDRLRLTWQPPDWTHDTILQLTVTAVSAGRARLGVHQERLTDAAEREQQRRHWQGVVDGLVRALDQTPSDTGSAGTP